jgi:hypothetical protein
MTVLSSLELPRAPEGALGFLRWQRGPSWPTLARCRAGLGEDWLSGLRSPPIRCLGDRGRPSDLDAA